MPFITRWHVLDDLFNRPVKLLIGKQEVHGIERGIDSQGALLLEKDGAIRSYIGGEISLRGF
jgi:BirA family biotin operon repressor/biotin-[acetyl-CoA-carboxylase] ligase